MQAPTEQPIMETDETYDQQMAPMGGGGSDPSALAPQQMQQVKKNRILKTRIRFVCGHKNYMHSQERFIFSISMFNCSQTKLVAIILVLSVFFYAIFRLTDFPLWCEGRFLVVEDTPTVDPPPYCPTPPPHPCCPQSAPRASPIPPPWLATDEQPLAKKAKLYFFAIFFKLFEHF